MLEDLAANDGIVMSNAVLNFYPPIPTRKSAAAAAAASGILEMPLNTAVAADGLVELTNTGDKAVRFSVMPCVLRDYTISFSPSSGTLKPRKSTKLKAKLTVRNKVNTNCRVTVHINNGASSHVVTAKIRCDTGVFGVDPHSLETGTDEDDGLTVPVLLLNLKHLLVKNGGLKSEGIFRLAGEQTVLRSAKDSLNRAAVCKMLSANSSIKQPATDGGPGFVLGNIEGLPEDVNDLATLIKIWYRELPQPILNVLSEEKITNNSEISDCVAALDLLEPLSRSLIDWLFDLMLDVAVNRLINKMTLQNLAIVIAPNLYEPTNPDPVQGLVMSQKVVQFVHNILIHKQAERDKKAAEAAAAEPAPAPAAAEPAPAATETSTAVEAEDPDKTPRKSKKLKKSKRYKEGEEEPATPEMRRSHRHHHHHHRHHDDNASKSPDGARSPEGSKDAPEEVKEKKEEEEKKETEEKKVADEEQPVEEKKEEEKPVEEKKDEPEKAVVDATTVEKKEENADEKKEEPSLEKLIQEHKEQSDEIREEATLILNVEEAGEDDERREESTDEKDDDDDDDDKKEESTDEKDEPEEKKEEPVEEKKEEEKKDEPEGKKDEPEEKEPEEKKEDKTDD